MTEPRIIQGGMGAGVSNWRLANAVARSGELGVVSGTALDVILIRRLQDGDPGGHMRRALAAFPVAPDSIAWIVEDFYRPEGRPAGTPYKNVAMHSLQAPRKLVLLNIVANFVEIYLAREGHSGVVGINYLEKIQLPNLTALYGAMLAGVDYVLMGAGIPREVPGIIDRFTRHEAASMTIHVLDAPSGAPPHATHLDPRAFFGTDDLPPITRPRFLPIVASASLASMLFKKSTGAIDGFIVEGPTAGGHNAPPRGKMTLNERGEPVFGLRDEIEVGKIAELGLPFWLAGSYGHPGKLREALEQGATGIQVGTPFAFCQESGLDPDAKEAVLRRVVEGRADVFTDPLASPTGFPFKVVRLENSNSEVEVYDARSRVCDLGFLRMPYVAPDGRLGYRCAAEPLADYVRKGGDAEDTVGRKCLCNGLMANIGQPQQREDDYLERPLVTAGNFLAELGCFLPADGNTRYTVEDVIRLLRA